MSARDEIARDDDAGPTSPTCATAHAFVHHAPEPSDVVEQVSNDLAGLQHALRDIASATNEQLRSQRAAVTDAAAANDARVGALYAGLYKQLHADMTTSVDARVARTSLALFAKFREHDDKINDLVFITNEVDEKCDALAEQMARLEGALSKSRRWSLFASTDAAVVADSPPAPAARIARNIAESPQVSPSRYAQ